MKQQNVILICLIMAGCSSLPQSSSVKFRSVAAGNAVVDCFALGKDQAFVYSFESSEDLDFNIYYEQNHQVLFPVDAPKSRNIRGRFKAPTSENYCLMWTNEQERDAEVTWTLRSGV